MTFARIPLISIALILSFACASTPAPSPESSHVSAISVRVKIQVPIFSDQTASGAYFARLDDHGALGEPIASSYSAGEYVYLFNAEPGRYAVVAASYVSTRNNPGSSTSVGVGGGVSVGVTTGTTSSESYVIYAPRSLIDQTVMTVGEGEIAFAGEIVLDQGGDWKSADETQMGYIDTLAPGHRQSNWLSRRLSFQGSHYAAPGYELDRSSSAWRRFRDSTDTELAGTGWETFEPPSVAAGPAEE